MIKIKIQNPTVYRNEPTFRPFLFIQNMLRDYSIEFTNSNDFDYLFIGMHDFIDKKKTLQVTVDEMRNFAFTYVEKYAPSKQQLKTYLLKKY